MTVEIIAKAIKLEDLIESSKRTIVRAQKELDTMGVKPDVIKSFRTIASAAGPKRRGGVMATDPDLSCYKYTHVAGKTVKTLNDKTYVLKEGIGVLIADFMRGRKANKAPHPNWRLLSPDFEDILNKSGFTLCDIGVNKGQMNSWRRHSSGMEISVINRIADKLNINPSMVAFTVAKKNIINLI